MSTNPALRYTEEHEWTLPDGELVRVGVTDFAQQQLGDVVFVDLPEAGDEVEQGEPLGEVESTKSVSDLFAPVSGRIGARNELLDERPELVNEDPYGKGWLVSIEPRDRAQLDALLDEEGYARLLPD